ncbi:hypothetical protein NIES4103_15480 [Nostoc sp. NIES-4103]|nr:hypothetical protein NIES4103_15480 [Nostoc sp. NIES-4103]
MRNFMIIIILVIVKSLVCLRFSLIIYIKNKAIPAFLRFFGFVSYFPNKELLDTIFILR